MMQRYDVVWLMLDQTDRAVARWDLYGVFPWELP